MKRQPAVSFLRGRSCRIPRLYRVVLFQDVVEAFGRSPGRRNSAPQQLSVDVVL